MRSLVAFVKVFVAVDRSKLIMDFANWGQLSNSPPGRYLKKCLKVLNPEDSHFIVFRGGNDFSHSRRK